MGHTLAPSVVEIYLCDPFGMRIECLDYVTEYDYTLLANEPGTFRLKMPAKFDRKNVRLDNIVEIWRGHLPGSLKMEYCGLLRAWKFADDAGVNYTELYGYSTMELLRRRIVKDNAGIVQTLMTGYADNLVKAIVKDQLGSDAIAGRNLTSVGGGFTIQDDLSDGQSITKDFFYKNVLEIAQEIADASKQAGTAVYFDVVPVQTSVTTGMLGLQLQTFTGQRGNDRTFDSSNPAYIGLDWGNLENGELTYDYSEEVNVAYALGQGEGLTREIVEVDDAPRKWKSIWNMREGSKDARSCDAGDTAALTGEAQTYLDEHKPKISFSGDIVETPAFRYGHDWWFGDKTTLVYADMELDANIDKVLVSRGDDGQETITARLELEDL